MTSSHVSPTSSGAAHGATLAPIDVALIVLYFVMVAAVGVGFCVKERRRAAADSTAGALNADSSTDSSSTAANAADSSTADRSSAAANGDSQEEQFFLAGRSMRWPEIGLSLFVSNIGAEHMLGLAGGGASSGIAVGWFEWSAGLHILVLGYLFAPIYLRCGIATLPEYLERRYGKRLRALLSCISLFIYIFTKLSVSVFSGATVLRSVFGWNRELAALGLVLLTAAYTALGGLAAVIVTDVAQSLVLLVGAACMAQVGFARVGGFAALQQDPPDGLTPGEWARFFRLYRPADDADYPTLGLLLGSNVGGLWYWCFDQAIVQRVLSARSTPHATAATVFAGLLKTTPVFLMVMPRGHATRRTAPAGHSVPPSAALRPVHRVRRR